MKNIALLCFLLLVSACVFFARADEKTPAVDALKMEDQPETADVMADEEQTEDYEIETKNDKVDAESDEEETKADDAQEDKEDKEDGNETTDIADEPKKRGFLPCKTFRKGNLSCVACECPPFCEIKYCNRRVCKPKNCSRKVCRYVTKQRLVKYKTRNPKYPGHGSLYLLKTKKVSYKVPVCKPVKKSCKPKCYKQRYECGRTCKQLLVCNTTVSNAKTNA